MFIALAKDIREKEIRFHPDRNKLLRVMGVQWGANSYELSKIQKKKKKHFLFALFRWILGAYYRKGDGVVPQRVFRFKKLD